jgi:glycosyltransferase involved in cell wall biosynthesis
VTTRERLRYPGRSLLEPLRIHRRSQRARFETDNARAFDQLLVNSLFSRENLLRIYGIEPKVCYLGVDTEVFRPTGAKREDMVLGVGTFFAAKNAGLLVEAVARLDPPRPRVEWISPGADEESERALHEAADRAEVELTIRRSADDQTLVDALNRARALAYTPRLEPFGLVPLEANACELPVIGVSEGGVRETVIDGVNGLLVEPTADELASAIHRLMTDRALAARLGREGRRIVTERWTLDAAAERLEAALEESLARGG